MSSSAPVANTSLRFPRLLLTGAAGALGRELRVRLKHYCDHLRLSDIADLGTAGLGEELMPARLEDADAVMALMRGVDAVVHLGGVSTEQPWEPILQGNIIGLYNLYEAARKLGTRRIVFASSNHVMGFYRQDEIVDARMPMRPDGLYGLSKAFGENLASLYWDRYGIETVSIRIGSSMPEATTRRMLATWMSYDDLERLVMASLTAPVVRHSVVFGVSDNNVRWYDNKYGDHIGYRAKDSSEQFRQAVEAKEPVLDRDDPGTLHQGGWFVHAGPFDN